MSTQNKQNMSSRDKEFFDKHFEIKKYTGQLDVHKTIPTQSPPKKPSIISYLTSLINRKKHSTSKVTPSNKGSKKGGRRSARKSRKNRR
jgi:hypothetical protein